MLRKYAVTGKQPVMVGKDMREPGDVFMAEPHEVARHLSRGGVEELVPEPVRKRIPEDEDGA